MTLAEFNSCVEDIAKSMDKYFEAEINCVSEINELVEFYLDKHKEKNNLYFIFPVEAK